MMKRFAYVLLAAVCALLLPAPARAFDSAPSSLTVIVRHGNTNIGGIGIAVCRVADMREDGGSFQATQAFSRAGTDFDAMTTETNIALAAALNTYAISNGIERATRTADGQGRAVFPGLAAGLYLVAQANAAGSTHIIAPSLISVPQRLTSGWNYDVEIFPKAQPVPQQGEIVSVRVYKMWAGATQHPASVRVQLCRNGTAFGSAVVLNAENSWSHTWAALDRRPASPGGEPYAWSVDEIDVPAGYNKSVTGNVSDGFVIINTFKPPATASLTTIQPLPTKQPIVYGAIDYSQPKTGGEINYVLPKTGEENNLEFWISLAGLSLVALVAVIIVMRRQRPKQPPTSA